jgi:hypothetical protein
VTKMIRFGICSRFLRGGYGRKCGDKRVQLGGPLHCQRGQISFAHKGHHHFAGIAFWVLCRSAAASRTEPELQNPFHIDLRSSLDWIRIVPYDQIGLADRCLVLMQVLHLLTMAA